MAQIGGNSLLAKSELLNLVPQQDKPKARTLIAKLERDVQLDLYRQVRAQANLALEQLLASGSDPVQYKLLCEVATLIQPKGN